jgi:hypothetical protein
VLHRNRYLGHRFNDDEIATATLLEAAEGPWRVTASRGTCSSTPDAKQGKHLPATFNI